MVNPRAPREARSSTAQTSPRQLVSPGSRPMTFTRRRVSPKVRSMKLECRTRVQCSRRGAQVVGQALSVGEQAAHRRGVGVAPPTGEPVDVLLYRGEGRQAGDDLGGQVEQGPVVGAAPVAGVASAAAEDRM